MNCIIIDDDKTARQLIKQLILKTKGMLLIDEFSSAIDAIKYLNANDVDLIFLDIHMPTFSGFDFIQTLKSPPKIILTTSDKDFAIQAFEYDCVVDYIVKPITKERFKKSLNKIQLLKDNDLASEKKLREIIVLYMLIYQKGLLKLIFQTFIL